MSDIQFDCPHCGATLAVDDEAAGTEFECPECGATLLLPATRPDVTNQSRGRAKPAIIAVVVFALVLSAGYIFVTKNRSASERAATQTFQDDLRSATQLILEESAHCINVCEEVAAEWNRYMEHTSDGAAIVSLEDRLAKKLKKHSDALASFKSRIDVGVADLSTPPQAMQKAHAAFTELYTLYVKIHQNASAPSGSYETYTSTLSDMRRELQSILDAQE